MSSRRHHSRSESPPAHLPGGADPITEKDYFVKNAEFSVWLYEEKRKYFNELSGEKARKYFRKFVHAWNRGELSKALYAGVDAAPKRSMTKHKWAFADRGRADESTSAHSSRTQGPSMPSRSDLVLARETAAETAAVDRSLERKRERRDARDREEDAVGPRAVGKERMLEKKAEKRASDRAFREGGDEGLELDESTLMGGGSSFQQELAKRDAAKRRTAERRGGAKQERAAELQERTIAIRDKEKATMDMFMEMAKNRFG